ncbi:MAG: TlpA family protein disulfide reductase [Bacteroidetes bacterium]|nr:TlpA family protein disulfide reductase [Bacteroidota bacterium]MBU1680381.1 TlpA family protein disulfide reductase [Bacteroidota bacterium]
MTDQNENNKFYLDKRKRGWLYSGIFFIVVLILFIVNNSGDGKEKGPYPPFYMEVSGKTVQLNDFTSKIVIIEFWATWDAQCRESVSSLVEIKNEFKDKGVEVIGISLDGVTRGGYTKADVPNFIEEFKINYPVVFGNETTAYQFGGIQSIPTSFILDREGFVIAKHEGLVSKRQYVDVIQTILANKHKSKELAKAPNFLLPAAN